MDEPKKKFAALRRLARESAPSRWSRKELAQVTLMKGAHQETLAPLLRDCPVKVMAAGEILLRAGEPCQALYLVLSGRLQMEDMTLSLPDTMIRAGDCIGELFLLDKTIVTGTVTAAEPTRLLVLDRNNAWALIRKSHEIARNWLLLLAERTRLSGIIAGNEELKTTHGHQLTHDERTGLHSRNWLESILPREVTRSATDGAPLGFLLAEIDGFVDYVAQFGLAAGDEACRIAAETLASNLRPTDLIATYGSAQFAIVLPNADIASACLAGERVRKAISKANMPNFGENGARLTVSLGATQLQPSGDAAALLAAAESALQMAKSRGGNRVGMR